MKKKKILVLGATGAMGVYLVPVLLSMGYAVDGVSLDTCVSDHKDLRYIKANALAEGALARLVDGGYDAIVDFMVYNTESFRTASPLLLNATDHYIYLSSYRVYANEETPIRETSPRLLDVSRDAEFLRSDDYALHKARGEDILRASGKTNWTVVRPTITYSKRRFQLVIHEASTLVNRAREGKLLVLPKEAMGVEATMSWAGDVATMIARLVCNREAFGEAYTLATAEHQPWGTVASYYEKLIGLRYVTVEKEDFLRAFDAEMPISFRWQLDYDRLFDRAVDNRKILTATGMKQSELMPLYEGLHRELSALPADFRFYNSPRNASLDAFLAERSMK